MNKLFLSLILVATFPLHANGDQPSDPAIIQPVEHQSPPGTPPMTPLIIISRPNENAVLVQPYDPYLPEESESDDDLSEDEELAWEQSEE